jgi:hypothetical protein
MVALISTLILTAPASLADNASPTDENPDQIWEDCPPEYKERIEYYTELGLQEEIDRRASVMSPPDEVDSLWCLDGILNMDFGLLFMIPDLSDILGQLEDMICDIQVEALKAAEDRIYGAIEQATGLAGGGGFSLGGQDISIGRIPGATLTIPEAGIQLESIRGTPGGGPMIDIEPPPLTHGTGASTGGASDGMTETPQGTGGGLFDGSFMKDLF